MSAECSPKRPLLNLSLDHLFIMVLMHGKPWAICKQNAGMGYPNMIYIHHVPHCSKGEQSNSLGPCCNPLSLPSSSPALFKMIT